VSAGVPTEGRAIPAGRNTRERGRRGEEAAVAALRERGYRILERNARLRRGEIDVVAEEGGAIVFVEVKSRRTASAGTPAEAVTLRKQRTLTRLAKAYLTRRSLGSVNCRFDVVEVWLDPHGRPTRVEILRDAFQE
jgi:putative endonuclease